MSHCVCPYWLGYLLASPLRRLWQKPEALLFPYVAGGMTVLEVGPGMGFFSLPLAGMVGPAGRVVCVDVQKEMIEALRRRALRAGLADRIVARLCEPTHLGVEDFSGEVDFVLALAVVHEIPDHARLFAEIARTLKPGGQLLVAEPKLHVPAREFERMMAAASQNGLRAVDRPRLAACHAVLMAAPTG